MCVYVHVFAVCVCVWFSLQLKRCQVPGVLLPLQGIEGSSVELIAAAADADGRAAMYGEWVAGRQAGYPCLECHARRALNAMPCTVNEAGGQQVKVCGCVGLGRCFCREGPVVLDGYN